MLVDAIDLYHFIPQSAALVKGHKVSFRFLTHFLNDQEKN